MKKPSVEFLKFFVVGFSAFLIDFAILNILVYFFDYRVKLFDFFLVANVISTLAAVLFGFYFQRKWTFKQSNSHHARREFALFLLLQAVNVLFYNGLVFNTLVNAGHLSIPVTKLLVVGVQMVTSFLVMKFLIFRKDAAPHESQTAKQ